MRVGLGRMPNPTIRGLGGHVWVLLVAILFAFAQWRLVVLAHGADYAAPIQEAQHIVLGIPVWRVYQSRVLGPYAVQVLSLLTRNYATAYALVYCFCLTVAGALSYLTGFLIKKRTGGLLAFFLFQSLFALCLDRHWLYLWDAIDILVFYAFFIIVILGASWRWTVLLFAVAIFNRESALFIALWLLGDPICRWALRRLRGKPAPVLDRSSMLAGALCMGLGILLVEGLRTALMVDELGIKQGVPSIHGEHFFLPYRQNLEDTIQALSFADHQLQIVVPCFVIVILALILWIALARPTVYLGAAFMSLVQLVAVAVFGVMYETRIFLEFIPFVVVATVMVMRTNSDAVASPRCGNSGDADSD